MEKISWTDHVRNEEVLYSIKEESSILRTIKWKANWIGHILHRNCLLTNIIEGKMGEWRRQKDEEEDFSS
jgi:replicative superfamily II helicase